MSTPDLLDDAEYRAAALSALRAESALCAEQLLHERVRVASAELALLRAQRTECLDLADDEANHRYLFTGQVSESNVRSALSKLAKWSRAEPGCDIEFVICSPGGSVFDGMALYDGLMSLRSAGHHLTTVALGYAASMGGVLLQAGDIRIMGAESYLLIHEVSSGAIGKVGELEDKAELMRMMCSRIRAIFLARAGGRISEADFEAGWHRTDWWLTPDDAVRLGFADEVR